MNINIADEIMKKDVDVKYFSNAIINDENLRDEIVGYAVNSTKIMLYYHSYYIVSDASQDAPELFYNHWDNFSALLKDSNSYKRDIGMTIIANLAAVDSQNKFDCLYNEYISHIDDNKFMTGECCINNLKKILPYKKHLIDSTVDILMKVDKKTSYSIKQKEVLKSNIIELFITIFDFTSNKGKIVNFIHKCTDSISPKTRKTAKNALKSFTKN